MTVAAELSAALHHSRDGGQVSHVGLRAQRTDSAADGEEEAHEQDFALRGQTQPPLGMRPAPLVEVAVSHEWWPGAPRKPGHVVPSTAAPLLAAPAAEGIDSATFSFLLQRALDDKRKEEEEAVETAELAKLDEKVAAAEVRLLDALQQDRDEGVRVTPQTWNSHSRVEQLAVRWYEAKDEVRKRKGKWRKKRRKRTRRMRRSW